MYYFTNGIIFFGLKRKVNKLEMKTIKKKEHDQEEERHRLLQVFSHSHKKCFSAPGIRMDTER